MKTCNKHTGGHKYVTLSFDDNTIQDIKLVKLLDKYQMKASFNVNSGSIGLKREQSFPQGTVDFTKLTKEEMQEYYKNHEVCIHTVNHPNLSLLDDKRVLYEINEDKRVLEEIMSKEVIGFAWPGGHYDMRLLNLLKNRTQVKFARSIESTYKFDMPEDFLQWHPTCHFSQAYQLMESFLEEENNKERLFYIWGHSWELDLHNSWTGFERFLFSLAEKAHNLAFVTNGDLYNKFW